MTVVVNVELRCNGNNYSFLNSCISIQIIDDFENCENLYLTLSIAMFIFCHLTFYDIAKTDTLLEIGIG